MTQRLEPDTVIDDRYRVVKRLGSGGMADVYCAEDSQLGRRVALKVLHMRFAEDREFVERFHREASSAAGLQHPNIVAIFDRGEWDGTYYIAMEYVEGRTLKEIVREKGLAPPDAAIDITLQILRAARYAHKRGIVHRDIKPHNVLIDQEGRVRVADFGIARAGTSDMTETGSIMGTAQYISPEQAQGRPVDARSDLYSIGVVLYELLTGRVPFDAESPVTVALMQVNEPPIPPMEIKPDIPPALDAIVMRALEKDPARRFADADEFIAALESARQAPQQVIAPPPVVEEVVEEEPRSRWWLWLLILLALAAIALGVYLLLRPEQLTVPDVIGRESATATQILQNRGFEVDIVNVENPQVERNTVAAQDPRPNTQAPEGSTVTINVSTGPGEATVPTVAGLPSDEAEAQLSDAGFETRVERQYSNRVERGRVIGTQPEAGSVVERGTTVVLLVSRGVEQVAVPDVVGDERGRRPCCARGRRSARRRTSRSRRTPTRSPAPCSSRTRPPAGRSTAARRSTSWWRRRRPRSRCRTCSTCREDEARSELEDAGFQVRVSDQTVTTRPRTASSRTRRPAPARSVPRGRRSGSRSAGSRRRRRPRRRRRRPALT